MKYHYVYRITNIESKKHYYGCRTSKVEPKLDLGVKYFSSSLDKDFKKDQIDNPNNYKYKIIKKYDNRIDAVKLEIKLHNKFDVGISESFYNRSKQTSTGWDTTGKVYWDSVKYGCDHHWYGKPLSDEVKRKLSESKKGKPGHRGFVTVTKDGVNWFNVTKEEYHSNKLVYTTRWAGVELSKETKKKISDVKRSKPLLECPFCRKLGTIQMLKRWHFEYCLLNPNKVDKDRTPHNKGKTLASMYA